MVDEQGTLHCNGCGEAKAPTEFVRRSRSPNGRASLCKACQTERARERYYTDARAARWYRSYAVARYGLTLDDYEALLAAQGGKCCICGTDQPGGNGNRSFHVDHDHSTGVVRGLLCANCNQGLGRFKDDPSLLMSAIWYLDDVRTMGPAPDRLDSAERGRLF